jgi:Zn-dependent metalloprotease
MQMKKCNSILRVGLLRSLIVASLLGVVASTVQGQVAQSAVLSQTRNTVDNTPTSITFGSEVGFQMAKPDVVFSGMLDISQGGPISMRLKNSITTKAGITTDRYDEYYKGIKVAHGGYTLTGRDGKVSFMTGNYYRPMSDLSALPSKSESQAFASALSFVGASKYKWQNPVEEEYIKKLYHKTDTSYLPKGVLVWIEDMRDDKEDRKLRLAYSFDIYAEEPLSRQVVFIDANDGHVLFSNQMIKHVAATGASRYSGVVPFQTATMPSTYHMFDSTRGDGVHTMNMGNGTSYGAATEFASATNTWPTIPSHDVAIDAHWAASEVYDYFFTEHGRLSWDGTNGLLLQYVHYGNNYNNAYWNGFSMTYGDGSGIAAGGFSPLTSMDVTAHEIGHGVCQATSDLIYEKESGALNEAFSDCWGATIEHWADPHEVDAMPKNAWEMGEEIGTEPLRSMSSPLLQGQPNTYGGTNWINVVGCTPTGGNDYCGVHRNSGLMNYWYYLLVNGGTGTNGLGNSYVVNPLGWTKSGIILYQSELVLANNATYADMRTATINAANVLYGPCSPEAQSVTNAWYAVGVGAQFVVCTPQIAFSVTKATVTEASPAVTCPASRTLNIGLKPIGTIAGGSPVANIVVAPTSTAVLGLDYTLSTTSVTFPPGDTSTRFFTMTIFDNGAVNDNKHVDLAFTVAPAGTGATVAPFNDSMTVVINNNDSLPYLGGVKYSTADNGIPVTSDFTSPFYGKQRRARSQYIIYADELVAAGVVPNVPITQIALNVLTKASTAPFIGFSVSMANTNVPDLYSNFVTAGLTQVYLGDHTTNLGIDSLDFNTGTFTWNGTSNVVVQFCYGMNAGTVSANDKVQGVQQSDYIIGNYNVTNTGSGTGCSLGFSTGNRVVVKPLMRFKQTVPPMTVETVATSTRVWNVRAGQEVYFYSTSDTQLIAGLRNPDNDLGCVAATVTQQGTGMLPAVFSAINRSLKEVSINPTINGAITTSDITFYMTNSELAGVDPTTLFLLKTTAPTDATVSTANSVVVPVTLIYGGNYVGFRASLTGYGRYMLVDGPLCNTPDAHITAAGPTSFCLGGSVVLSTPIGTGYTYQWQKDGVNIAGATSNIYSAALGGSYVVIVNQSVCDSVSLPVSVVLDSAFTAPITGAVTSICLGQTTTLASATSGGVWTTSDVAVATVSAGGVVTSVGAGTVVISYTVTGPCGSAVATYSLTVNAPTAVPPIAGPTVACEGSSITLTNAASPGVWISGSPAVAIITAGGVLSGLATGTTVVTYEHTNVFGCVSSANLTVTVNTTPIATTTPTGSFVLCTGGITTFSALPSGAGYSYQWQMGASDITGATSATYTTGTAGTYRVRIATGAGCFSFSPDIILTLSPTATVVPTIVVNALPGTNVCATSAPVNFTTTITNGGTTPGYSWAINGTFVGASGSSYSYVPANGDVVSCQLTSSNTCAVPSVVTGSVTMTVNPLVTPAVNVTTTPNDTVCVGDAVSFTATPTFGGTAPAYWWTRNGVFAGVGSTYSLATPADGDVVICRMVSNVACPAITTVNSTPHTIRVMPNVVQSVEISSSPAVFVPGVPMTFVAVTTNAGTTPGYQWFINTTAVAGATNITFTSNTLSLGQYVHCKVTTSLPCATPYIVMSNGIEMKTGGGSTGIADMDGGSRFRIMPNPNRGTFAMTGQIAGGGNDALSFSVVNILGQIIYSGEVHLRDGVLNSDVTLPVNIASGVYFINLTSGTTHDVIPFTIEK